MAFSYWEQDSFIGTPDICIVGCGIVGLNAAISLKSKAPLLNVLILERGSLPAGASTKNAGFACFGSISELLLDLETQSEDDVFSLVEKRWNGLTRLRETLGDESIFYESSGGYEIFPSADKEMFDECESNITRFNKLLSTITGLKTMYINADKEIKRFGFAGIEHMILNIGEGQLDTGRMMYSLIEKATTLGVKILNGFNIRSYTNNHNAVKITTANDENIFCKKLLITTNGFASELISDIDVQPARAQVLVTNELESLPFQGSFHYDRGYYYFRNIGKRVLLGGGRNLAFEEENTSLQELNPSIQSHLEQLLKTMILPDQKFEIQNRWTGIMGLGSSKKSIVKKIEPNIWCAVRLGGMGVAIGNLVAEEVANMIFEEV